MSAGSLEERVTTLEEQMAALLLGRKTHSSKNWRQTIGMFTGDELMRRVCQNALDYRDEDRRRSLAEFDAARDAAE